MLFAALITHRVGFAAPPEPAAAEDFGCIIDGRAISRIAELEELKFERKLSQVVSLHFDEVPLQDAVKQIGKLTALNVFLDTAGLEDEGITADIAVSLNVDNVRLKSALNLLLAPLRLEWAIKDDVLKITSRIKIQNQPKIVKYEVADLVTSRSTVTDRQGARPAVLSADFKPLINLLTTTIQPHSWEAASGPGTIKTSPATYGLIINQTQAIHDEIADLFGQLRRLSDLAVSLKVVILTAPKARLPEFANAAEIVAAPISTEKQVLPARGRDAGDNTWPSLWRYWESPSDVDHDAGCFVKGDRAKLLLRYLRHRTTTSISPVPSICLMNGQTSDLSYDVPAVGARDAASYGLKINAVIAGDRKMLRLKITVPVAGDAKAAESTISFAVRHQETVICDVTRLLEIYRQPVVGGGDVTPRAPRDHKPDKAALKPNDVREFLVITPQVLMPEEEEELLGVDLPKR
jgi:hypothetical protein